MCGGGKLGVCFILVWVGVVMFFFFFVCLVCEFCGVGYFVLSVGACGAV